MINPITTVFLTLIRFITTKVIKRTSSYYNKELPRGYSYTKIFNKIYNHYSDCIKGSSKSNIRTLLRVRRSMLNDINKLTINSLVRAPPPECTY